MGLYEKLCQTATSFRFKAFLVCFTYIKLGTKSLTFKNKYLKIKFLLLKDFSEGMILLLDFGYK